MSCIINATSSSNTDTVNDISSDIGRMDISSKDGGDISVRNMSGGEEERIGNKKCTSCEQNIVSGEIGGDIDAKDICANCGKEGSDINNTCNKCKEVKYCNAACKKKHRHKHKKDCEEHQRRAAELQEEELRRVAELHDEQLFKQPPPPEEDCPICFIRLPTLRSGSRHKACCGKIVCSGCIYAVQKTDGGVGVCPFCRVPSPLSDDEVVRRLQKRIQVDMEAIHSLGDSYSEGMYGFAQDQIKALELYNRAAELGCSTSYFSIGCMYYNGKGVERDEKRAIHYFELGAIGGCVLARHNLGVLEDRADNTKSAVKHYIIAVESGDYDSLKLIRRSYFLGHATKDEYAKALRAYQKYLVEVRSSQRDEAAAFEERYKYFELAPAKK